MYHIRLVVAVDQCFGYVQKSACQGEWSDNTCQNRTICDEFACFFDSININLGTTCTDFRNFESLCLFFCGNDGTDNGWNLIIRYTDGGTESFCLKRQIH